MDRSSPYYKAHLTTAAVRLADHREGVPPTVSQLRDITGYSVEEIQIICNKLKELGVFKMVMAGDVERIYIKDPGPLEDLPRVEKGPDMEKEVEKFAKKQQARMVDISTKAKGEKQRKQDLFAALEAQLKKNVDEGDGPLENS